MCPSEVTGTWEESKEEVGAVLGLGRPLRALPLEPWACVLHFSTSLPTASGPLMPYKGSSC